MAVGSPKKRRTKEGNDDCDSPKRRVPVAGSSPLPDHLRKIVTKARHNNSNHGHVEKRTDADGNNNNADDVLRCRYCFKYYDCVSRWRPPMENTYFLQCKRHRKSYLYWCKHHQVGFRTKALFIEHCCNCNFGSNVNSNLTGECCSNGNSGVRRTGTSKISESCGGMPYSHSWTYNHNRDDVTVDKLQMSSSAVANRYTRASGGYYNQTPGILCNKLISWTYALNDDNASKPSASRQRNYNYDDAVQRL